MHPALEATIDEQGRVTLLEKLALSSPRKAVVVVLDVTEPVASHKLPPALVSLREPRDEWERALRALAVDCGVSLTDEQLSREKMYE